MPEPTKKVMISSTALDLPEHRKQVLDACMRQSMFPVMMEHLPAADADAIAESLRMVDEAEIYLGIFAQRYGYVPKGHDISVTEMEYNRAVERGIPRLLFLMHGDHPLKAADVEKGAGAVKLEALKDRLKAERVVSFFDSPADLRAKVIDSLSRYRVADLTAFHYVGDIPTSPAPYIAHPYTLSQTRGLVGRQAELRQLTDWVAQPGAVVYQARILNIVAIGGMGKSALTWKWFNEIAPLEMQPLAGRMWWSFYESDASFENFVIRALAYVSGRAREQIEKETKPGEREAMLLSALDHAPFLIVLDGLERILIAYARMDAARLADDDLDEQTANIIASVSGLPASAAQSFVGQHRLRKTADPRVGGFLRKLASVRASRILVSTRLYPADLQNITGEPLPGSDARFLRGLSDDDALDLWRAFGVTGTRETLLPLFHSFESHPLLIHALASEVARYRHAPGDFARWRKNHPHFDPFRLPIVQVRTHVLEFALRGLDEDARKLLHTVAAFRMPASYDTLVALLAGVDKTFAHEQALDSALAELEDRGLLGWDRRANRYDLHPIVRGVTWGGLNEQARRDLYGALHDHFEALPTVDFDDINSLDDLTPAIELYNTLIGLARYDDACDLFYDRLEDATQYRLSASRQRAELLELLFPDGLDQVPRLNKTNDQSYTLNSLALAYQYSGQPGRTAPLFRLAADSAEQQDDQNNLSTGLYNLSYALRLSRALHESEAAARRALQIAREQANCYQEAIGLQLLGTTLAARGERNDAEIALRRSLRLFVEQSDSQAEGVVNAYLAQRALWLGDYAAACSLADRAGQLAHVQRYEAAFIRAARLQGAAALGLGDEAVADERLHHALARARAVTLVQEELPALVGLAELRRRQDRPDEARELLDDVWELAERGPYPLFHADAFNVLTQIERDAGNIEAAIIAATRAYELAWCDGPPFAYHWGLVAARAHLAALGAPEPALPPFDETKYAPMVAVALDPPENEA
jgi:hypothetical protein